MFGDILKVVPKVVLARVKAVSALRAQSAVNVQGDLTVGGTEWHKTLSLPHYSLFLKDPPPVKHKE